MENNKKLIHLSVEESLLKDLDELRQRLQDSMGVEVSKNAFCVKIFKDYVARTNKSQ